jgi:hypothetical protein
MLADSPALKKVMSFLVKFRNQIPHPHSSHQARSMVLPLSESCMYVFGGGLDVWTSAVFTKRCAECLTMRVS